MIESKLLPGRVLFDTSTLVCALLVDSKEPDAAGFRELFLALLEHGKVVLVSAPSLAELLRKPEVSALPRRDGIEVVPFDGTAARFLAERLPLHAITRAKTSGAPANYIKYDAMIVACAIRHRAECMITKDGQQTTMASAANLRCASFRDFQTPQMPLLPIH